MVNSGLMMVVEWDLMGFHGNKPSGKRFTGKSPERTGKWLIEIDGLYLFKMVIKRLHKPGKVHHV